MGRVPIPLARPDPDLMYQVGRQRSHPALAPQSYDPNRSTYVPPWDGRVTTREAADALIELARVLSWHTERVETYITPQEAGCVGYEEL